MIILYLQCLKYVVELVLHECVGLCLGALPQKFVLHTILLREKPLILTTESVTNNKKINKMPRLQHILWVSRVTCHMVTYHWLPWLALMGRSFITNCKQQVSSYINTLITEALLLAKTGDIKEQLRQGYFMLMCSTSHCPNFTTRFGHGAEDDGKISYSRVIKRMR